jgi:hypothetical protein
MAPDVAPIWWSISMRSTFIALGLVGMLVTSGHAEVRAQPIAGAATMVPGGAPIGHLQPRAQQFAPRSASEQAQQEEMSNFDAQQKLDEELDKHLNICRGC